MSDDVAVKNFERVMKLVETFPEPRKTAIEKMLNGPTGLHYFSAPASTKEQFHSAYPGGLCQHSLNVVANLWRLAKDLCPGVFENHKLAFVGLFHDLGKVGHDGVERYVVNPSEWHRKHGNNFETNKDLRWMEHAHGSIYILQSHGVTLDYDEFVAIMTHDGQYNEMNRSYRMREPKLTLLLHWADMWSTMDEKGSV